jgi:hypothetical protein
MKLGETTAVNISILLYLYFMRLLNSLISWNDSRFLLKLYFQTKSKTKTSLRDLRI